MVKSSGLQKGLKERHVSLIALGGTIGSCYFLGSGYVLNQIGPAAFLAYALGGIIIFITMACFAELLVSAPLRGSFIAYANNYGSPSWAAGVGWSYWISWVICIPSECIAAGILAHHFFPQAGIFVWTVLCGFLVTFVNLLHVKAFGEMEFWLSLVKIGLICFFALFAVLIFFGLVGADRGQIIGGRYLLNNGGLFPNGFLIFFFNMVVLLNNLQGAEIVGITASEAHNPQVTVPKALRKVTIRIVMLYLFPTFLLGLVLPWQDSNLSQSAFSQVFAQNGFSQVAHLFNFLIIAASISFANSGIYGSSRCLYSLSVKKLAPSVLKKTNKDGVPFVSILCTLIVVWILIIGSYFFNVHDLYAILLASSGFTGSICWISICLSQYVFRKKKEGSLKSLSKIKCKVIGYPWLTLFGVAIQIFCLLIVVFSSSLRVSFYVGAPAVAIPMLLYWMGAKHKKSKANF
jgi:AAT family amino acid transporter